MILRRMEKLNVSTSLLGFGAMRFPLNSDGSVDEKQATKMIRYAKDNGVNYFDTAYIYHNEKSEEILSRALSVYPRESYFLADKMPTWLVDSEEKAQEIFDEQLKRCNTDYFDFYLIHSINQAYWNKHVIPYKLIEFCQQKKKEGKIKHLGFSFHDGRGFFGRVLRYTDWDFCQIQFNYMDYDKQAKVSGIKLAEKMGIPIVVMEPIKGGWLAQLPEKATEPMRKINNDSPATWALRYVASFKNVKVILSGMSSMEQVKSNVNLMQDCKPLNTKEKQAIIEVREYINSCMRVGCTGCRYCMPCPSGVNIPKVFALWNEYGMYGNTTRSINDWSNLENQRKPISCIKCGKCETHCPQHIDIREKLKSAQAEMDNIKK